MGKLKRIFALILGLALLATLTMVPVSAVETADALKLETIGVLKGTGSGVDAAYRASVPMRYQAAWLFLRLLGKEADAKAFAGTANFGDSGTARTSAGNPLTAENKKMLAYLFSNQNLGFQGYTDQTFRPFVQINAQMYYKLMLVALGYVEGTDFTWDNVFDKVVAYGLTATKPSNTGTFNIDALAKATVEALKANLKNGTKTLVDKLVEDDKSIDAEKASQVQLYSGEATPTTAAPTTAAPTTAAPTTTKAPTTTVASTDYPGATIVASSTSTTEWKNKATYVCPAGELPGALKNAIEAGNKTFVFAPGEYYIDSDLRHIELGTNTTLAGATRIIQPGNRETILYPDPTTMAVFKTRANLPSTTECSASDFGQIVVGGTGAKVIDIAIAGYAILKIQNASDATITRVLVHNYNGTYPNGNWCNMGYGRATGSIWINQNCQNIKIENCQIQFSSHHGFLIHSGSTGYTARDINLIGVRALYSGCGQLMGQSSTEKTNARAKMPETDGHGYYDWSVGFDLCEAQTIINVKAVNCYAYESWKAGFYTEPAMTGGPITNLQLIGCRSDNAGQRAMLPGTSLKVGNNPSEDSGTTIFKEGEGANFYLQGGYFEDCVSVNGLKAGWYVSTELRTTANGYDNEGRAHLVDCGDMGSPISLLTEMYDCPGVHTDRFFSLNAKEFAMWLFSGSDNQIRNTIILSSNKVNEPIKIGYMLRMQLRFSRDANNQRNTSTGGKYDVLRGSFTNSTITGTVYGLPINIGTSEIVSGASFSGPITLTRSTGTINTADYVD